MLFSLDVRRARKGDCLLLHFGHSDEPRLAMIDGGPKGVYKPQLRPRIDEIRKARGLGTNQPLIVDLLMISHVDDDHIQGILELTDELRTAQMERRPKRVQVYDLWHNSFDNIIGRTPTELTNAMKDKFGPASLSGNPPDDLTLDAKTDMSDEEVRSSLKVLASIQQGAQLRKDAKMLGIELNVEFDGKLIMAQKEAVEMEGGLSLTVIGPMPAEVKALHAKHQAWLKDLQKKGEKPGDVLSAYVDKSIPNLSSIVVLAETDNKSMLLTGDARGDKILKGLELTGVIDKGGTIHVDLLKVPHHGSSNNLDNDFFERITADYYVFSGDGEHGNPERESLEMLWEARGDDDYTVHLTYPIDEIDLERKKDWEKERNKEINRGKKGKDVRPVWSAKKHSLAALFDENETFASKLSIVEEGKPHVINLLADVDF